VTLRKNVNPDAKELKQDLNKTKDTLILSSEFKISKVEILNGEFRQYTYPNSGLANVHIGRLPEGRNNVYVYVNKKIIALNIIIDNIVRPTEVKKDSVKKTQVNLIKNDPRIKAYWVVYEVNDNFGSHGSSFIADRKRVDYLIRKNMADLNTCTGYRNTLTVIGINDLDRFRYLKSFGRIEGIPIYKTKR